MEKNRRVVVYLPPKLHRELKAMLSLKDVTVSEYVREMIEATLSQNREQNHVRHSQ
jgi:metal-responsive CopG/Arc/MetJ family transcriptional regulator